MARVLFLIDQIASGGAPRSVLKITRALLAAGSHVTLISLSDRLGLPIPEDAEAHVVPFTPKGRWQKLHRYQLHANILNEFLDNNRLEFDLVVSHLHHAHQVARRSKLADSAWMCIRSDPLQELLSNKHGWRRSIKLRKIRRLYGNKRIIALSSTNLRSLEQLGVRPAKTLVIPNVLEVSHIQARMLEPIPEPELRDTHFCVYVGRLNMRQKRLDRLLRGYQASGTELPLVLIGDGDRDAVEKEIESLGLQQRVTLLGARDNPYPYMRQASVLLLASDYEGLPNVLLEALACGTPVVSTDCLSGPSDILTGDLVRGLVPLNDIDRYGQAIREMLEAPPTITSEAIAAYTPEAVASRYLSLPTVST
ncbi:hypothetical protein L861_02060 [Litchfieldella anticariensis FP35 = DSM 16096]|uniref:Glycosyltransferase subfamily 4-like N-terminal domain-containing protein n=1 Tax=Litchfieldella anticariensis (strain DSM 16096 / CECT 5854 / CIP 108499 / LMG 22089 / FP35) TaxID=1121939 RepID=S2KPT9_LITA3|nr:glycosyltransferase [Halomonas anticariensis]EPC04117.1 hypothetical protein L861_02060 [Halomonas anticariensis FP35 = DSM 16096]